jgi:hypothetical protein
MKLSIESNERDSLLVRLAGVMDQEMDLTRLEQALILGSRAVLDLSGVDRINSGGVREWMRFVRSVPAGLELVACPPAFVDQLNIIHGFAGTAVVRSIQIPFYCPSCNVGKTTVEPTASLVDGSPEPVSCDNCGEAMECDVLADSYFGFLHVT